MKTELIKKAIFKNGRVWEFKGCIDMYQRKDTGDIIYGWRNAYHEEMVRICSMSEFDEVVQALEIEFLENCGCDLSNGYTEEDIVCYISTHPVVWEYTCLDKCEIKSKGFTLWTGTDSIPENVESVMTRTGKIYHKSTIWYDNLRWYDHPYMKDIVAYALDEDKSVNHFKEADLLIIDCLERELNEALRYPDNNIRRIESQELKLLIGKLKDSVGKIEKIYNIKRV